MPFTADQFNVLTEKTLLFLIILNKNGEIIDYNRRCKILFASDRSSKGKLITDFVIDEDISIFTDSISNLSEENSIITKSFSFSTKKDGVLSIKFDFIFYNDLIYATGIDITDEYKEHRALMTISKLTKTGAWYYNPRTEDLFWSSGCYIIKELDPDIQLTREKGASYYPEETREKVEGLLDRLIQDKKPYEYTEKILTEKGNQKWVRAVAQPVIFRGEVVFVNGTIADVTDRHNYIEKLKRNEETKHLALKGIRSGLFDHLIKENIVYYSKDFRAMLGLPLDKDFVPEETFRAMIHPEDADEALQRHLDNLNKEGAYYHNNFRIKHLDGNYRHYEVHGYRRKNKKGETIRMVGNLIDVHQRILNEKTIEENKNRLQAMVNNGYAYTILLDPNGKILMSDEKTTNIIKRDYNIDHTANATQFIDVIPMNFKNEFAYEFNEALKGNTVKKDIERVSYEGKLQWFETKFTPILQDNEHINSILISFHDITEQKLAEASIKEAHLKEKELSQLKSNILSNFSHEIRTPLNGIITISQLLSTEEQPNEQIKLLQYLSESNDRLLKTVNNLSSYSEIENIKNNLTFTTVDINYTVETSFREYRHMARAKNLKYHLELDQTSPMATIDESLFKPALDNIINNAIKYTEQGEIILEISSKESKNNIYITVKDTGIGIKQVNLRKIFDPFVQESFGLSRKYEGTGIGLSLSKRYFEILGGKVKVTSELGKGTEFSIIIPKSL